MGFNFDQIGRGVLDEVSNTKNKGGAQATLPRSNDQLTNVFGSYDSINNDSQLSWDELRAAFKYLGSHCSYFRTGQAFNYADENMDGFIDLSNVELSELVTYAYRCGYKCSS
ncbi:EF-hand domain pair [Trema orientale]|uniref:EF-hand domain pair n=1 Tax=Trema orientale TaxID=63057 RepID=A0A2P5E178_TREOI|nr:EF-hand domain pair [Trema orientale]